MPEMPVTNKHVVSRACDPEARLSDVPVDGTPSQTDPTAADHCVNPSDQVAPPSAPVVPSPAAFDLVALRERAESVMLGDGERPIASGIAAIASEATYGLIIAVRDVVSKLWAQRQDEIKAACRPQLIDEVDVLAYVTADALGRPQMHPDDTNAVGKRIESFAKRIRREKLPEATKAARRTAARAPGATKEAVAAAVAAAEAALLGQVYAGLKLPDRTVGRKRKEREQAVGEPREAEHVQHGLATVLATVLTTELAWAEATWPSRDRQEEAFKAAEAETERALRAKELASAQVTSAFMVTEKLATRAEQAREHRRVSTKRSPPWDNWRLRESEAEHASYHAASDRFDQACEADDEAEQVAEWKHTQWQRICDWMFYPDVLTPFPWPDAEYIIPCNEDDILYYRTCPRGFPAGVREFGERLWAHHEALGHQAPHRLLRYSARVSECHYVACADAADELRPVPA